jgi:hypothetical protein
MCAAEFSGETMTAHAKYPPRNASPMSAHVVSVYAAQRANPLHHQSLIAQIAELNSSFSKKGVGGQ